MADFILSMVQGVIERLESSAYEEVKLAWGVEDDLRELKEMLASIKTVLLDAEQKQNKNRELQNWLVKLQHLCYDAEDVLDEFDAETQRRRLGEQRNISGKVRYYASCVNRLRFRFKMAHKMLHLRERVEKIAAEKSAFNLSTTPEDRTIVQRKETHSFAPVSNIIGRKEDKKRIIELLIGSSDVGKISVIPIVGIGGLGKTTLAKLAFADEKVSEHFDYRVWISMQIDFDVKTIIKDIIQSLSPDTKCDNWNMESLQRDLRMKLEDKRCLFVFDDVWKVTRHGWLELRELLEGVSHGSRIIVTSRIKTVASIMGPALVPQYNLKNLSEDDSVTLFLKCAFEQGAEKNHPELVEIGREIVRKCGGNPLAVKTMGSLLYSGTEQNWITVRDSEIWKMETEILPSLRISYDLMPSYLKQCFAFCSIFPKSYEFNNLELIQLWIANGLVQSSDGNKQDLEEIGQQYWEELWSRSFFEEVQEDLLFVTFKMHDLIHDLSLSVAQHESSVINADNKDVHDRTRHLSFTDPSMLSSKFAKDLHKLTGLRTIMFPIKKEGPAGESFLRTCVSTFKHLRVLYLHDSSFEELPDSVGNLKHLRFLHLCGNRRLKRLPSTVCNLQYLQSLGVAGCEELEELPTDMKKMVNLRFLDMTTKQKFLPENGIECLTSLRALFIGDSPNLESLNQDLQSLKSLKKLFIGGCPKLKSLPRGIMYLNSLENMWICNCESLKILDGEESGPPIQLRLRSLTLSRLPKMVNFPKWLQMSARSLRSITIEDCCNFRTLPEWLQNCSSLQKLNIVDCPRVSPLPKSIERLSPLKELNIENCGELSSLCSKAGEDWPKIAHIKEIYIDRNRIK